MFAESTRVCFLIRNIVLYIMNIPFSRPYLFFSLSIILYLYTEMRTLFPALYLSRTFLTLSFVTLLLYTLYIERNILSRNFLPLSRPFPYFYYTPIIYRMIHTFPAPFLPLYKVNTFTPPLSLSF